MSQKGKGRKKKSKVKKVSFKDKQWYTVIAPKNFNYKEIGEIIGLENNLVGRTVEVLLYDFTGDYNDISLKLKFKVISVNPEAKTCNSIFIGHEYTSDYVRSLIGRGSSKIQVILNLTTKDSFVYRLTALCVTLKRARSSQQIVIRKIMTEILKEFAKSLNHEKFISGMVYGEFARQIQRVAKTIYPLSNSTIIKSKLISMPEGAMDTVYVPREEEFEVIEVDVKRTRKSEIRRTERINVKKLAQAKTTEPEKEETTSEAESE